MRCETNILIVNKLKIVQSIIFFLNKQGTEIVFRFDKTKNIVDVHCKDQYFPLFTSNRQMEQFTLRTFLI